MKPRILVLYYTQTGQLRNILNSITHDMQGEADINFVAIEPEKPFPFPWSASQFFDAMPETVERIPLPMKKLPADVFNKEYDLVLFGYQPWFLNPSQPINGFLKSEDARILKGKKVVTVVGARNMWLHAQEKVKEELISNGSTLVGNIVLIDTHPNLISLLTVIRWTIKGQKEPSKRLPEAGVSGKDVERARRFGLPILNHLKQNKLDTLQQELLAEGSVTLNPGLVLLEQRGIKNFRFWAKYIREKGGPGAPERQGRVKKFQRLLLTAIFVLSPISSISAFIKLQLNKRRLLKDVEYFKQTAYEKGRI